MGSGPEELAMHSSRIGEIMFKAGEKRGLPLHLVVE